MMFRPVSKSPEANALVKRQALLAARAYMANPQARLPRVLAAYSKFQAQGTIRWVLPEA